MIYTIGHRQNYLNAFSNCVPVFKMGKRPGYTGGYAFKSIQDAVVRIIEAYQDCDYAIFGLKTDWENTEPSLDGWWHYLIEDAEIIKLEDILGQDEMNENANSKTEDI